METFWELLIASSASQRWSGVNFSVCFAAVSFALSRITNIELPHNNIVGVLPLIIIMTATA